MVVHKKKPKKTVYHLKKGAKSAAFHFLWAFGIFVLIVLVTGFFILFQWKSVEFRTTLEDIDRLTRDILVLNAENSQLESNKNELLEKVPHRAKEKLGMINPVEQPKIISVDEKKLRYYEKKEQKIQNQSPQNPK